VTPKEGVEDIKGRDKLEKNRAVYRDCIIVIFTIASVFLLRVGDYGPQRPGKERGRRLANPRDRNGVLSGCSTT